MSISTKAEMLEQLRSYASTPDDDSIRFKEKVKQTLLKCPEILYVLDNPDYEDELFDDDGNIISDGEWDQYFGDNIRPYVYIPDTQDETKNFICYKVECESVDDGNAVFKDCLITFVIFCSGQNIIDKETGLARHDLLAALITEQFNWSNIFGLQCELVSSLEATTDKRYVSRQLEFVCTVPNSITQTRNGVTSIINKYGR